MLEDRRALLDAIFQLAKWVIATLFILNGAAALAVLSRTDLDPVASAVVALYFIRGIMAAIVAASLFVTGLLSSYVRVMHMINPLGRAVISAMIAMQLVAATGTVIAVGSSVNAFVNGVKGFASLSVEAAKEQEAE